MVTGTMFGNFSILGIGRVAEILRQQIVLEREWCNYRSKTKYYFNLYF